MTFGAGPLSAGTPRSQTKLYTALRPWGIRGTSEPPWTVTATPVAVGTTSTSASSEPRPRVPWIIGAQPDLFVSSVAEPTAVAGVVRIGGGKHTIRAQSIGVIFPRKMTVVHSPAHRQGEETRKPLGRKTSAGSEDRLKVRPFPHSSQEDAASSSAKGGTIFLVKFVLFTTSQNG